MNIIKIIFLNVKIVLKNKKVVRKTFIHSRNKKIIRRKSYKPTIFNNQENIVNQFKNQEGTSSEKWKISIERLNPFQGNVVFVCCEFNKTDNSSIVNEVKDENGIGWTKEIFNYNLFLKL